MNEFLSYYKINLNLSEDELDNFSNIIKTPLPCSFRIIKNNDIISKKLEEYPFVKKINFIENGYFVELSKKELREKKEFRKLLVSLVDCGMAYRQEMVSMLPVLFLDVQPDDAVLDMCAAPGSKTMQILEKIDKGILISNDINFNRLQVLKSFTNNIYKPHIITAHNAYQFPNTKLFDKILCDVPCTGDGTMRKNEDIMKKWNISGGIGMQKLQTKILKRGIELCKENGLIVYSTCSLNPVENEYVIQEVLKEGKIRIEQVSPKFKHSEGLVQWEVSKNFKSDGNEELKKCVRVYPHHLNSGGFFFCVLRRIYNNVEKEINNKNSLDAKKEKDLQKYDIEITEGINVNDIILKPIKPEIKNLIEEQYEIKIDEILVATEEKNLYLLYKKMLEYINSKLKIYSIGNKSIILNKFDVISYRIKNYNLIQNPIEISKEDFEILVEKEEIELKYLKVRPNKGMGVLCYNGIDLTIWSNDKKIKTFINKEHRKCYSLLFCFENNDIKTSLE
ncbi:methytransferase [Spraguea lophii 42_110]|uniref:Methytransferase n=1 Tax=Spraguea lophii (strain 42_110) TaxID=1358809 RepID=S7W7E8_SPRLO|nr:methytransferase [Spraguea lophii 42_110]